MNTSLTFRVNSWESIPSHVLSDGVFTPEELEKICVFCKENGNLSDGGIGASSGTSVVNKDIRDSQIKFFNYEQDTSWIFKKFKLAIEKVNNEFYNFDLLGFDKFQYSEYNGQGSKYDFHIDAFLGKRDVNLMRKLSVSLLLSDPEKDFEGGKLELLTGGSANEVHQKKGTAVFFPSFIMHRVAPIIKGNRKSLVVWVLGPKFK